MPNGADKKLNFVAKVYDPNYIDPLTSKKGGFRPIYIAPDATDKVQGDVKLSDDTNSTLKAATGMTAATPAAVKAVQDNANKKLDKEITNAQTVKSAVTFSGLVTGSAGFKGHLTGDVTGNANSASQLKTPRTISVKSGSSAAGSATFNGAGNVVITIPKIDGTTIEGLVPLNSIPQGAIDHLVKVANQTERLKLTTASVQLGDSVLQTDTGVMYIVVDDTKLNSAAGYQEYKASTALDSLHADEADTADKLTTARTIRTNLASTSAASFNGTANITPGVTGTLPIANGGTGATTALAANNAILASTVVGSADWNDNTMIAYISSVPNATQGALRKYSSINVWSHWLNPKIAASYATKSHTHANATTSAAGFLPKLSGSTTQYLRGDGTWATVQVGVTGVKGNAEATYRTGNVNLTPANIGAAAASHTHQAFQATGQTGSVSNDIPIWCAAIPELSNKSFALPASQVTIEKTTNGGSSWTDAGVSSATKLNLFSETTDGLVLGKTTSQGLRITMNASTTRYTRPLFLYLWHDGPGSSVVKVESATKGAPTKFTTILSGIGIAGWGGPNVIGLGDAIETWGGSSSQTTNIGLIRLTIFPASTQTSDITIRDIRLYGSTNWIIPNNYARYGRAYTIDSSLNCAFPAKVTATNLITTDNPEIVVSSSQPTNSNAKLWVKV